MKQIKVMYALLALIMGVFSTTAPAFAQSDESLEELRQCAEIEHDSQRHTCYDRVLRPRPGTSGVDASPVKPLPSSPATPAPVVQPAAAAPPAPVVQPAAGAPPSESDTDRPRKTKFGLKDERPEEPDWIDVVVVRARKNAAGKFVFTTQDGQVWLQTDVRRPVYHGIPFPARIRKASLGSFFIVPGNGDQTVRVRRRK